MPIADLKSSQAYRGIMSLKEICSLGSRKYFEDHGNYNNPYSSGTPEFNEFERGWMQSLKRDEGKLIGTLDKHVPYARHDLPERTRDIPSEAEIQAEQYRARKG